MSNLQLLQIIVPISYSLKSVFEESRAVALNLAVHNDVMFAV